MASGARPVRAATVSTPTCTPARNSSRSAWLIAKDTTSPSIRLAPIRDSLPLIARGYRSGLPVIGHAGFIVACSLGLAARWCRKAGKRGIQVTEAGAFAVHVRPATRADAPGIAQVSNSSVVPGEDAGFGGGTDSPFRDASVLVAIRAD